MTTQSEPEFVKEVTWTFQINRSYWVTSGLVVDADGQNIDMREFGLDEDSGVNLLRKGPGNWVEDNEEGEIKMRPGQFKVVTEWLEAHLDDLPVSEFRVQAEMEVPEQSTTVKHSPQ